MMADQPQVLMRYPDKEIELLHLDFLSLPEAEIDSLMSAIEVWMEQINRKNRESKRYRQIVRKAQSPKRVEKDFAYLFELRYSENVTFREHDDTSIQAFLRFLPLGGFLQAIFRLSLNDLRGI
jgi:hypothetical protein